MALPSNEINTKTNFDTESVSGHAFSGVEA